MNKQEYQEKIKANSKARKDAEAKDLDVTFYDSEHIRLKQEFYNPPKPTPKPRTPTAEELEYQSLITKIESETTTDLETRRYLALDRKYRGF